MARRSLDAEDGVIKTEGLVVAELDDEDVNSATLNEVDNGATTKTMSQRGAAKSGR